MKFRPAILCVVFCGLAGGTAAGQSFTMTRPSGGGAMAAAGAAGEPAGRDFATDVIGDAWDFEQETDYNLQYSLHPTNAYLSAWVGRPALVNGVFTGIAATSAPKISLQFEGIEGGLNMAGKNGVRYPIDANRYRRLSFRVRRPATGIDYDLMQVMWFRDIVRNANSAGGRLWPAIGYNQQGSRYNNQMPADRQRSGWQIFKVDLDLPGGVWAHGVPWTGTMRGIEITLGDQYTTALVNRTVEVDWVRLTERGTAVVNLSFSGFGGPVTVMAQHAETGDVVQITPDNGTAATTFADGTSFLWDYGFLPPGTWTITASRGSTSRSQTLVIDPPPVIHVTEPDVSGGRDFARAVIGDAWDLTNPQDITRYGRVYDMTPPTYDENGLTATTLGPGGDLPGGGDAFVALADDAITYPRELVIPADNYHRLTFTLEYLTGKELPGPIALGWDWGSVFRVAWRSRAHGQNVPFSETRPAVVLDGGPHTFSMDLKTLTKTGPVEPAIEPWSPVLWTGEIGTLRIDVNEAGGVDRPFRLSNVKLAADDEPNGSGFFVVRWRVSDATFSRQVADGGGADATVTLFYNTSDNPAGRISIPGAVNLPATRGYFAWNVAGLSPGTYWVFAQVTDAAGNTQIRPSTGPVRVRAGLVPPTDRDGNGLADAWEARYGVHSPTADDDGDGVSNLDEYRLGTDPRLPNRWVLSEGATGYFSERLALVNPNPEDASVVISYLRKGAGPVVRDYTVAGNSRLTVDVNAIAGLANEAVSAVVTATEGGVLVERSMFWGDLWYGGHTGKGVPSSRTSWYLAEGEANFFDTYILLANAGANAANVTIDYLLTEGAPVRRTYTLAANSRETICANDIAGVRGKQFSASVTSDQPITVERAMYFSNRGRVWNGGHGAAAVEAPATEWFVAEGRTGPMFDTYLLLANPNPAPTTVTIRYLRPTGPVITEERTLDRQSRMTRYLDEIPGLEDTDVSASITATLPIVVERAMYWPGNFHQWEEAHASAGVTSTGTLWGLAEGEHGGGRAFETYILVANPSDADASVKLTLLRAAGLTPLVLTKTVPRNSRLTVSSWEFPLASGEKFGALVESTNEVPIVVERSLYWNGGGVPWGGGSNETGIKLR